MPRARRNSDGVSGLLSSLPELNEAPERLFDTADAQANSCYSAIEKPKSGDDHKGQKTLRIVPPNRLWPGKDAPLIYPQGEAAHDMLRAHILGEHYPCIGARAAFMKGGYRFGFYKELGCVSSAGPMGRDLRRFVGEYERIGEFTTFVAVFQNPQISTEAEFETKLWQHLQLLHDHDGNQWDPNYSPDPQDPHFAFSFAGKAFFVVGMHAGSSRFSRRLAFPALIFNPESQILRLKEEGMIERFAATVRKRDTQYQGSINPSLPVDSSTIGGEARVYSGKENREGGGWKCPFHTRKAVLEKHAAEKSE